MIFEPTAGITRPRSWLEPDEPPRNICYCNECGSEFDSNQEGVSSVSLRFRTGYCKTCSEGIEREWEEKHQKPA